MAAAAWVLLGLAVAQAAAPRPAPAGSLYGQAPGLAAAAAAGQLPPVEARLPKNPLLVSPVEQTGQYGGSWRTVLFQDRDGQWLDRTIGCDNLARWNPEWTRVIPNLAEHMAVNDSATEYRFRLRRGLRWSDGAPFTVDDILFWFQQVFLPNEKTLESSIPWLFAEGHPCTVQAEDAQTVVFRFDSPHGLFLRFLAGANGDEPTRYPRHYLARFTPPPEAWAPTNTSERIWQEFFHGPRGVKGAIGRTRWRDGALPTLNAWQLSKTDDTGGYLEARRNAYYWKIDVAGNQLPYLDGVRFQRVPTAEALLDLAVQGGIDLAERSLTIWSHLPLLESNRTRGDYRFVSTLRDRSATAAIALNLNHPDPETRKLFQNKDFRIGLSHAIDRDRIIRDVYAGLGSPAQPSPRPESPFYEPRLARQYTEYSPALAGVFLDKAGLHRSDPQGLRLFAGARPCVFRVAAVMGEHLEALRIIRQNWLAAGVQIEILALDNGAFTKLLEANGHDAAVWWGEGGLDPVSDPRNFFPFSRHSPQALLWARWFADPQDPKAEEPPPAVGRQMTLYRQLRSTPDPARQADLMRQILQITAEEFPVLGVSWEPTGAILVRNDFRNVPAMMPNAGATYLCPSPANPCQFYLRRPGAARP